MSPSEPRRSRAIGSHGRPRISLAWASAACALLGPVALACGPAAPLPDQPAAVVIAPAASSAPAPSEPEGRFRCEVEVAALGPEVVGEASREGPGDLSEDAWSRACEALRAAHGSDCHDDEAVASVSRQQQMSFRDGKLSQSLRIVLRPLLLEVKGKASSEASHEDACKRAVERACEQAPKGSACGLLGLPCEADAADPSLWRCSRKLGPRREEPASIFGA